MKAFEADGPVFRPAPSSSRRGLGRGAFHGLLFASLLAAAMAAGIGAGMESPRTLMTPHDYVEARKALEAETRFALGECRKLEGLEKLVCRAQARGEDRVRKAQLEARYRGTVAAEAHVDAARAKARYELARAKRASI